MVSVLQRLARPIATLCLAIIPATVAVADPDMDALANGIWIDRQELATLPISGPDWEEVTEDAQLATINPNLSNQDDPTNVRVFAKALVYVRTGEQRYRDEVIDACMAAIGTEEGGTSLALGRELMAYVIAADLVGLPEEQDVTFRAWLGGVMSKTMSEGRTLRETNAVRPNNWGTHAGASRLAAAAYLRDAEEIEEVARLFKGWLGDREAYTGFKFGDLYWQADPAAPVGINPEGASRDGHSIDGVLPDDQRRGGDFQWPPPRENYVYEALQGAIAQAVILERAGYDAFQWQDKALLRAFHWLHEQADYPANGDDTWQPYLINHFYGTDFPAPLPSRPGKNVGYTEWTHGHSATLPRPQNLRPDAPAL